MKKVILILAISTLVFNCKNKAALAPATSSQGTITCIWSTNQNGVKTFYRCVSSTSEIQQAAMEIRDAENSMSTAVKATCAECQ